MYSARNWEDILYKEEVLELMSQCPQLYTTIHLTHSTAALPDLSAYDRVRVKTGRINRDHLLDMSDKSTVAYLCGPPLLSESVSDVLEGQVDEVNFEKWWWLFETTNFCTY